MIEDLDEFKKLYCEFYEKLPQAYTEPICPFFMQVGKEYQQSHTKCLFVGKATAGWVTTSKDVDLLFSREHRDRIANRDDEIQWVENMTSKESGYNTNISAFWRVVKETTNRLFPTSDWYTHIAWSNLYKFGPGSGDTPSEKLQSIQRDICSKILDKEIEYLMPDCVIFLTSGWELFYLTHRRLETDYTKLKCREWDKYRTYYQKKEGITYIHSQHPERKKEAQHIEALVEIIKGKL